MGCLVAVCAVSGMRWSLLQPPLAEGHQVCVLRVGVDQVRPGVGRAVRATAHQGRVNARANVPEVGQIRSEEHTSELQSQSNLVCRLLLEKKKKQSQEVMK